MDHEPRIVDCDEWRIMADETPRSATEQMALDCVLAAEAVPTARFFRWHPPAVSLGWKQPQPEWLGSSVWAAAGLEAVERPTGGGVAFHGSDVSISVTVPRVEKISLHSFMDAVCRSAVALCRSYGADASPLLDAAAASRIMYCLTELSPYAVMIDGRKVGGFALRRFPQSWLIQGSLLIRPLPQMLEHALPSDLLHRLRDRAMTLSEASIDVMDESTVAHRWAASWANWWNTFLKWPADPLNDPVTRWPSGQSSSVTWSPDHLATP